MIYKLLCTLALFFVATACRAEWFEYSPADCVDGQGIVRDVLSRTGRAAYFQQKYQGDIPTLCHEATHGLSNRICNSAGRQAFYVGSGRCCILPEPRITLSAVARYVEQQYRNNAYFNLYLVQQPSSQPIINQMPLYVFDEWSAAINGWQAAREEGVSPTGDDAMSRIFCAFADALIEAIRRHDPQYREMSELIEFVGHQKQRVSQLAGVR